MAKSLVRVAAVCLLLSGWLLGIDRNAFTFTRYELNVAVTPAAQALAASGKIALRNDSAAPQRNAVLQISSSLEWKTITVGGKTVQYVAQPYTSDVDHTGMLSEAIVTLPRDVPPGGSVEIEVAYEGAIAADAMRLTRIGTPAAIAARNDWDQIGEKFTAVRGVGYVAWYPVAMDAVSLSSGNEVFEALGEWKQRHAHSSLRFTLTFPSQFAAVANGLPESGRGPGSASFSFPELGLAVPTFAIGGYNTIPQQCQGCQNLVHYLAGHENAARDYSAVVGEVQPLVTQWFGGIRHAVQIVELADANAAPFESGPMLFTPLRTADRATIQLIMAHQLAHATLDSTRPWIYEGVAHFAQALEREQQAGRAAALAYMGAHLPELAEAEKQAHAAPQPPPAPSQAAVAPPPPPSLPRPQPLVTASDEVFYRTKAMYCWWMLRDIIGDAPLQRALAKYRAADDREPAYVQRLLEAEAHRSLEWFFDDWIYRDRGLPDFRVESAFPRETLAGGYGVTVTVENLGDAAAEVPVTVRAEHSERSARTQIAARQKGVVRVLVPATPVEAVVNDGSVPESDMKNNALVIKVERK